VIDADVMIDILRHRPKAVAWFADLTSTQRISGATALELLFGSQDTAELHRVQHFLKRFQIEWSTASDLKTASEIASLKLSSGIQSLDAISAATALRLNEDMLTFNEKHFRAVPRLNVDRPYDRS